MSIEILSEFFTLNFCRWPRPAEKIRFAGKAGAGYYPGMRTLTRFLLIALPLGALWPSGAPVFAQAPAAAAQSAPAAQAAPAPPALKSWMVRIIPPRPTFDKDATPAEDALMDQHFAYWKDKFDKGLCVFGGPVLDPRGVYGVLAIRAATEDEARALANGDPSVKAGLNKVEVAEMVIAFLSKSK
jgi:uncharacterized protein YciI